MSRAVVELTDLDPVGIDAGMASSSPSAASEVGTDPGRDIRRATAAPAAEGRFHRARTIGESIDAERAMVGESIPGGTTTALAVLTALGERPAVSSSLAENPMVLKERVVAVDAEAKAATLLHHVGVPGTTTDAVLAACETPAAGGPGPIADRRPHQFSGAATRVGAAVRACVRETVGAALEARYQDRPMPTSVADADHGVTTDVRAEIFDPLPAKETE